MRQINPSIPLFALCLSSMLFLACDQLLNPSTVEKLEPLKESEAFEDIVDGFQDFTSEISEMSKPNRVMSWVDNLIIKAQPGKDMPKIGNLRKDEVAEYLYQRTRRKSSFDLRGQRYNQPWILIRTSGGQMGWVHEGGIRYIQPTIKDFMSEFEAPAGSNGVRSLSPYDLPGASRPSLAPVSNSQFDIRPGKSLGPIKVNTSEQDLIQIYGASNLGRANVVTSGNKQEASTVVYPNTNDEIRIVWKDVNRTKIKAIYLDKPKSQWRMLNGLYVGMPVLDLCKANRAPVTFYGFDWEYGGTVNAFGKGDLERHKKYFYVVLDPTGVKKSNLGGFKGNKLFSSNDIGVEQLNLHVKRIVVYLD